MNTKKDSWKRTFYTIFAGQAFSLLGSAVVQFSIIWWLTEETGSAVVLTIASMAGFLPQALIGPFAGTIVDRLDRKKIMIAADMFIAFVSLVLAMLFFAGMEPPVWAFYVILGLRSIGSAFHMPSMQASIPLIAPEDQLMKVQGWMQTLTSAVHMAGPMLGAFLLAYFSMEAVLLLDVLGALLASAALLMVHIPNPERSAPEEGASGMRSEIKAGLRELMKSKGLLVITAAIGFTTFVYVPVGALFTLMVLNHFGKGAWHAGVVEFSFAAGMLVGSLLLGSWGAKRNRVYLLTGGIALLGAGLFFAGLLPVSGFVGFVLLSGLMGVSGPLFGGPFAVLLQTTIDPAVQGRVMSLVNSLMLIATPIGLLVAGPVAEAIGVDSWFSLSGIAIVLIGLCPLLFPAVRELKASAASQ
ncbi:MFS transporter [Brevibacillus parabrevis]|uniref:MFS transporter n=1 Tax=Brevibacillus parabrevis TaxID=54914 RepID=A0A4Y3PNU3_BREPA|nr:MFS transporter [Brevibacillus parabrevis]RNB97553.1 MFS transporter [Brevibacillus parabrevis]GEB33646.1 MFS transporter [Brevibacillus parabrevis]